VAHYSYGSALRQKGRLDEAIIQYREALRINPGYANALNNLGTALRQKGRLNEAIIQFQLALKVMPDNESIHFNLARALYQKGRVEEAIIQFQLALQIEPNDMEVQNNLAWLLATSPQASLRNGDEALKLARQANELSGGGNPIVLHTLAAAFAEAGRFPEAVEIAQRALRLAAAQSNTNLAGQLQLEMKLYEAGSPFHSPAQRH
jgi:tetratricopeptide (TPR) repeat protein